MKIRVTDTNNEDQISIRTRSSEYSFRVTNPSICKGLLSGGALGHEQREVFLAGTIFPSRSRSLTSEWAELETGGCAVFLMAGESLDRLTTSVISEITCCWSRPTSSAEEIHRLADAGPGNDQLYYHER